MPRITEDVWEQALETLRREIGDSGVRAWLMKTRFDGYSETDQSVTIAVPNEFYLRWISRRYLAQIEAALQEVSHPSVAVHLVVREDLERLEAAPNGSHRIERNGAAAARRDQEDLFTNRDDEEEGDPLAAPEINHAPSRGRARNRNAGRADSLPEPPPANGASTAPAFSLRAYNRLNPRYIFDEYVVGESNRYAHASAHALADSRASGLSPLFLYGGTGLGKTHLMQAIGHQMLSAKPGMKVLYVTSEQFINHYIDSIAHKKTREFRQYYRSADLLLIDDVQFLLGKDKSQTEFFHTFNALCEAEKKVVVSSDRPPKDLQSFEDRLRSRFEWGLLVDIQPPDLETRVAILRKKAEKEKLVLPVDCAIFIAERVTSNVRELEGVLRRLKVQASLNNRPVDLDMIRDILGVAVVGTHGRALAIEDIQRAVCDYFQIRMADMLGKNRTKKFARPRHIAQFLCRKLTDFSFPDIALKFGGKDHTSIIYACRKMESMQQKDSSLSNALRFLEDQIVKNQDR